MKKALFLVLFSLFFSSLARATDVNETKKLYWPPAPSEPRIEYVASFASPEDLGLRKGFFTRLKEMVIGKKDMRFSTPMAVVEAADGKIYVADPGVNGVHRFDTKKGRYDLISGKESLLSPVGLAAGAGGEVYVADSQAGKVFIITPASDKAMPLSLNADLKQPTGIYIDSKNGLLYVIDSGLHALKAFGIDEKLHFSVGNRGIEKGEFNYPVGIWKDVSGNLIVSDALNFRVQILDPEGKYISSFGKMGDATGDFSRPKGVASDSFGHIYVVDSLLHAFQIFNDSGEFLLSVGGLGNGPGEFRLPTGIFITKEDKIYVADSRNSRVQIFRYVGGK